MNYRSTLALVACLASSVGAVDRVVAGVNPNFTLPLHAKVSAFELCNGYLPVDCLGVRPTVQVESGQPVAVFLFVANYTQLAGIQTAFEVNPSWTYSFGLWDCLSGEFADVNPFPPFGPTNGTLNSAFNCVTSGELAPLGRMFFVSGTGCIGQMKAHSRLVSMPSIATRRSIKSSRANPGKEGGLGRSASEPVVMTPAIA
jgi:hypothetical protein